MTDRDGLRELRRRLAERLQSARTEPAQRAWLAAEAGGCGVLFPLHEAGEIFPVAQLQPVPHTQPWFAGVANLRGGLHAVVDLAAFLGLRPRAGTPGDGARLLALNAALGVNCALLVDRLAGLRQAGQLQAEPDDEAAPARPGFAGGRWRDDAGRLWQEIDLTALAGNEHFLGVAA